MKIDILAWICELIIDIYKAISFLALVIGATFILYSWLDYKDSPEYELRAIYSDIREAYGKDAPYIPLYFSENKRVNAYTNGQKIVFERGLYGLLYSQNDALAFILAHEYAHVMMEHTRGWTCYTNSQMCEQQADRLALILTDRAGYDGCVGASQSFEAMAWIYDSLELEAPGSTHPALLQRAIEMCSKDKIIEEAKNGN